MELNNFLFNDNVISTVKQYLANPTGSVVLFGEKGLGKHILARQIAMHLLNVDENELNIHPDFLEVSSSNRVIKTCDLDLIRELIGLSCVDAKRKVFIIDDANLMTLTAQNSLLKMLEDMNEKAVFILVCHEKILQTIESRCCKIKMVPLPLEQVSQFISKTSVVDELAIALSGGCIGTYFRYLQKPDFLSVVHRFYDVFHLKSVRKMLTALSMLKEKDGKNFFERFEIDEIRSFMQMLSDVLNEVLFHVTFGKSFYHLFSEFVNLDEASKQFSSLEILALQKILREHIMRINQKGIYTKNDFFDLIRHFEGG